MLRDLLKLPYYLIKNLQYNNETLRIMKRVIKVDSNCIDVGCHKGKFLDRMIALAPQGTHWGFEPLPHLYEKLKTKYEHTNTTLLPYALSDTEGESSYTFVKNAAGYSGFKKRTYHIPFPKLTAISVKRKKLDTVIPAGTRIDFIKIDVEGAELEVLHGAEQTIKRNKPYIIFEHGIGAAPHYGTKPGDIFNFFQDCEMKISLLKDWILNKKELSRDSFSIQFYKDLNYYFIAYP